jgi:hypothetical protein
MYIEAWGVDQVVECLPHQAQDPEFKLQYSSCHKKITNFKMHIELGADGSSLGG